jgi:hypothetical protein
MPGMPSGPHDNDCACARCHARREIDRERRISLHYELSGLVRAFLDSRSMKTLAETEMDFEWWFRSLSKKVADIDSAEK